MVWYGTGTVPVEISASADTSVAHAAPGGFAGEKIYELCLDNNVFFFHSRSLRMWEARIALLLLPLKSISCAEHFRFARR